MDYASIKSVGPAVGQLMTGTTAPITVIGNEAIHKTFDSQTLQQACRTLDQRTVDVQFQAQDI